MDTAHKFHLLIEIKGIQEVSREFLIGWLTGYFYPRSFNMSHLSKEILYELYIDCVNETVEG